MAQIFVVPMSSPTINSEFCIFSVYVVECVLWWRYFYGRILDWFVNSFLCCLNPFVKQQLYYPLHHASHNRLHCWILNWSFCNRASPHDSFLLYKKFSACWISDRANLHHQLKLSGSRWVGSIQILFADRRWFVDCWQREHWCAQFPAELWGELFNA